MKKLWYIINKQTLPKAKCKWVNINTLELHTTTPWKISKDTLKFDETVSLYCKHHINQKYVRMHQSSAAIINNFPKVTELEYIFHRF